MPATDTRHADAIGEARSKLFPPGSPATQLRDRLMAAEMVMRKVESNPRELVVESLVSSSNRRPRVDVTWRGQLIQMDPDEARATAAIFVEAANLADLEADMVAALEKVGGLSPAVASHILNDVRIIRESRKGGH